MAIGLSLDEIRHHTLSDLGLYDDAQPFKDEIKDMWNWLMGAYVQEAMSVTLANAFSKKGAKEAKYRNEPFLKGKRELTEAEKKAQVQALFGKLEVMKSNFDRKQGDKKCPQ